jgi:seryl-tRNA synthetase
MDDLARWLTAQLDEDERIARAAGDSFGFAWTADGDVVSSEIDYVSVVEEPGSPTEYIAEHDPARALREIDAKRDLLRFAEGIHDHRETFTTGVASRLEETLRLFALAYADRDGYQESWRP